MLYAIFGVRILDKHTWELLMDEEEILENELELESIVRTLSASSIDQELRNLLVLKSSFLSDLMKSVTEIARNPIMLSSSEKSDELAESMKVSLDLIIEESGVLLKQYDHAIDVAQGKKDPPKLEV